MRQLRKTVTYAPELPKEEERLENSSKINAKNLHLDITYLTANNRR